MKELVIATSNKGKLREIKELLNPLNIEISSVCEYNIEPPEEDGETFAANSLIKAKYYGDIIGMPTIADDSGLSVNALNGAPGIYSSRWAVDDDFYIAMQRVKDELDSINADDYSAEFICSITIYNPIDNSHVEFSGNVKGQLTFPPRGLLGFGYDPIFIPDGHNKTFGEIDAYEKQKISHRAKALKALYNHDFFKI